MFKAKSLTLSVLAIPFLYSVVSACQCRPIVSISDELERSSLVIAARLKSINKVPEEMPPVSGETIRSVIMTVEKVYKGKGRIGEELIFAQGGGSDCIWTFNEKSVGTQWLFYLDEANRGFRYPISSAEKSGDVFYASGCGRSNSAGGRKDDLTYLNNLVKFRGRSALSGMVSVRGSNIKPIVGSSVSVRNTSKTYESKIDSDGYFFFHDLPPGEYTVEFAIPNRFEVGIFWPTREPGSDEPHLIEAFERNRTQITIEAGKTKGLDVVVEVRK